MALTDDQKKILESSRKKEVKIPVSPVVQAPDLSSLLLANMLQNQTQQPGGSSSNLLALLGAGKKTPAKKRFIDKSEHLCFKCQQIGHWATDETCPKFKKKEDEGK